MKTGTTLLLVVGILGCTVGGSYLYCKDALQTSNPVQISNTNKLSKNIVLNQKTATMDSQVSVSNKQPDVWNVGDEITQQNVISYLNKKLEGSVHITSLSSQDLNILSGTPTISGATPSELKDKLCNKYKVNVILSPNTMEHSQYIYVTEINNQVVYVVNLMNPFKIDTLSGNAYMFIVGADGHIFTPKELLNSISNNNIVIPPEPYPYNKFFEVCNLSTMISNSGSFTLGTILYR